MGNYFAKLSPCLAQPTGQTDQVSDQKPDQATHSDTISEGVQDQATQTDAVSDGVEDQAIQPDTASEGIEEGKDAYRPGGFHPVYIGDVFNDRYKVLNKIGYGQYSTVWLVKDLQAR